MRPETNILFLMSGSIACAKATGLISAWSKEGHAVQVGVTPSVAEFVGRATLEGLSGRPLFEDTFEPGRAMDHITLAQWADLVVICPASANLLARLANGIADNGVTTLWQATWDRGVPHVIVPAMNTHMWRYPATQDNIARLERWGVHVLPTAEGDLACGESGAGRMLEIEEIHARVAALADDGARAPGATLTPPATAAASKGLRILVTGGGTREPIDAVRYIGNHSSGRTAATLVDTLQRLGHEVTWLGGAGAVAPRAAVACYRFDAFSDLASELEARLGEQHFDAIIHAAAVSDFSVDPGCLEGAGHGKLSSGDGLELRLTPNPKLLHRLRDWSLNPSVRVVGFKLTVGADEATQAAAVERVFADGASDFVVHNDTTRMVDGRHPFTLVGPARDQVEIEGAEALATLLSERLHTSVRASSPAVNTEESMGQGSPARNGRPKLEAVSS